MGKQLSQGGLPLISPLSSPSFPLLLLCCHGAPAGWIAAASAERAEVILCVIEDFCCVFKRTQLHCMQPKRVHNVCVHVCRPALLAIRFLRLSVQSISSTWLQTSVRCYLAHIWAQLRIFLVVLIHVGLCVCFLGASVPALLQVSPTDHMTYTAGKQTLDIPPSLLLRVLIPAACQCFAL